MSAPAHARAIDLFCGLRQTKFCRRADLPVEQLVTCRAKNPDHMPLHVCDSAPRTISLEIRLMCDLYNASLAASLARRRQVWISTPNAADDTVLASLCFIDRTTFLVLAAGPHAPKFARRFDRTSDRAVPLIGAGRNNLKARSAPTQSALLCRALVFVATNAASALCAIIAAPFFVRTLRREGLLAQPTRQIVHGDIVQ